MINKEKLIQSLKNGSYQKISFLLGAGISTNAGIPDFRSKTGRYTKIKEKYKLDNVKDAQSFFSLKFFKNNPEIFYEYMKLANFDSYKPTLTHFFMKLLQDKNMLKLVFTQNIDSLEERAGVNSDKIVYAHGNYNEAVCSVCRKQHSVKELRKHIEQSNIMYCDMCSNPCKYSVVLFGEPMPESFFQNKNLLSDSDLVFIIGTSLAVKPFAYLVNSFSDTVPKIIIDKENMLEKDEINKLVSNKEYFLNLVGNCDDVINNLAKEIGWTDQLDNLRL
jgi:NAD-dependent histone deacetylase SIR2